MFADDWLINRKMKFMLMFTTAWLLLVNIASGQDSSKVCGNGVCTADYRPQCGNDGITYSNLCNMELAQCNKPSLQLAHEGVCKDVKREANDKPGDCPEESGICFKQTHGCESDRDCEGIEKCCWTGCSPICTKPAGKPGYCPAIGLGSAGICVSECSNDWDCQDSDKCCSNGCGHTCQKARISKPGECPPIDEDNILCVDQINPCKTDMDCGGVEKCCWTGCSPICTEPAPRQGMCPAVPSDTVGTCVNECEDDNGCDFPKKCCSNGCGNTCQYPEEPKAGICPAVEEGMFGLCVESCSRDSDCEGEEKCCSNGCGHACRPPANNTCKVDGKEYLPGPVPDPDGCNSCKCMAGGNGVACTRMMCMCEMNGESYYMGESYPADDGCNTCKCRGDRDHLRHPCTDYYCGDGEHGERRGYMKKVAIFAACVGGIGFIITIIVLIAIYCVYKKNNNKKQSKVNTVDQTKAQLVADAGPLPPKA